MVRMVRNEKASRIPSLTPDIQGEKGEQKSGGKPPERESHLSLFSLAAAMETVENRKRFTHRSHSLRSPSFSSLPFSLYREKCPFSIQKTYSCRDEQRSACQYGKEKQTAHRRFYPQKKPRNMTKEKPSTTPLSWCWVFSRKLTLRLSQSAAAHL